MKSGYRLIIIFCFAVFFFAGTSFVIAKEKGNDSSGYTKDNQFILPMSPSIAINSPVVKIMTSSIPTPNINLTKNLISVTKRLEWYYGGLSKGRVTTNPTSSWVACSNLKKIESWSQTGPNQFQHCIKSPACPAAKKDTTNPQDATYSTECKTVPVCDGTNGGTLTGNDINAQCAPDSVVGTGTPTPTQTTTLTPTPTQTIKIWAPLTGTSRPTFNFEEPTTAVPTTSEPTPTYCPPNDPYCY